MKNCNLIKLVLTFPYFLLKLFKVKRYNWLIKRDRTVVREEKRYKLLKKVSRYVLWLHNVKIKVFGIENWLDGGILLCSNHQSGSDPLILFLLNNFNWTAPCAFIAKEELKNNKTSFMFMNLIDCVYINRNNLRQTANALVKAKNLLKVPRSMVVFPEGTRNPHNDKLLEFKPGSFKVAQKAYVPILPVTIHNSKSVMSSRFKRKRITVIFHKVIASSKVLNSNTSVLRAIIQKKVQEGLDNIKYYQKKAISRRRIKKYLFKKQKEKSDNKNLNLKSPKLKLFSKKNKK